MPARRSIKKKGRLQEAEAASKSIKTIYDDGHAADHLDEEEDVGSTCPIVEEPSTREAQTEYVERIIEEVEAKAREWCDAIMDENASNIRMQKRTRDRVKNKINRKFRHMKLSDLCHMSGNDYNAALLMAVPPEERAVLLAEAGEDTDEEEDDEENMPTAVKGRNPPRMVPVTPKGGGRPAGSRVTRSAVKGARTSSRLSAAVAAEPLPVEAGAVAQTPTGRARGAGGRAMRSAVKGGGAPGRDVYPLSTSIENVPKLSESVITELHKRFDPDCTVWQCLDIVFQPKIEGYTRHAEAVCAELRQNIAERSRQLRARIPPLPTDPPEKKKAKKKAKTAKPRAKPRARRGAAAGGDVEVSSPVAEVVKEEEEEVVEEEEEVIEEEEEEEAGGTAKVALSISGGPYDGSVFEITVEEDGDARLVGRSTGKKFKNHGISLRRDSEVSITHGMFMNSGGRVTYMDNGSTNGTEVDGEWVEPKNAYEVVAGSTLLIGQSHCTVAIAWER
ncbi:unnamed protein product [Ectocarpus sp. 8 AP-2014]